MSELTVVERHAVQANRHYTEAERRTFVEAALHHYSNAGSLERAAEEVGVSLSSLYSWIEADVSWAKLYEELKIKRSRALMERALHEMYENPDYKQAEARARILMKQAALLNPTEFSEKVQSAARSAAQHKAVGFVFNIGSQQARITQDDDGCVTVDVTPNSGDIP